MKHLFSLSLCVATLVAAASTALGQTGPVGNGTSAGPKGPIAQSPSSLAGSTWSGSENLGGFGKLTFVFKDQQNAIMVDAKATVGGTYVVNGSNVTIRFKNCVYTGTLNGNVLTGSAQYTEGQGSNFTWTWNVAMQGAAAPAMPGTQTGPSGPTGPTGPTGPAGFSGPAAPVSPAGAPGFTGPTGPVTKGM
jgi:hypothetical protein